jgi:hypothetical protein
MIHALAADRARIVDFDAQIQDLERSLSALRNQRAVVQERLDSYKYPVLTLPNEIICDIFIHFLPVYPSCPPIAGPHSPILLTHICREWRRIALAFPSLWRAVALSFDDPARLLSVVLGRSGSCPLSICVDEQNGRSGGERVELVSTVLPHRERWQYLSLRLATDYPSIGGPIPLLQHLELKLYDAYGWPRFSFAEAPLLRTAILNNFAVVNVILPWTQLTSLTLENIWLHEGVPILQQAANLVRCELEICNFGGASPSDGVDVALLSLESLTLSFHAWDMVVNDKNYLQAFVAPALCSLEIPERFLGPNPIDSLSSFISNLGCRLQRVDIVDRNAVPENSYRTAFSSIPMSFTRLYVGDGEDSEESSGSSDG